MKRFLMGVAMGLFLGWVTVPFLKAAYSVSQSDAAVAVPSEPLYHGQHPNHHQASDLLDSDDDQPRAYKDFLRRMLSSMKEMNTHLQAIEDNTKALKEKLHA